VKLGQKAYKLDGHKIAEKPLYDFFTSQWQFMQYLETKEADS